MVNTRSSISLEDGGIWYIGEEGQRWQLTELSDSRCLFSDAEHGDEIVFEHSTDGHWHAVLTFAPNYLEYDLVKVAPVPELLADKKPPLTGYFEGYIEVQGQQLPTAIEFVDENGQQMAYSNTPRNLILDKPLSRVCYNPPNLSFGFSDGSETLEINGILKEDSIIGKMNSREMAATVHLKRVGNYQRPAVNYTKENTVVSHDGVSLPATLFLPKTNKPCPAVVMVCGTGQHSRDEYFGWADMFAKKGIAVLVYDKRNVTVFPDINIRQRLSDIGKLEDLAADAEAAFTLLSSRKEVNPNKTGLLGFSQGAVIVPLIAARNPKVAFVIAVSGNATSDAEWIKFQTASRLRTAGAPATIINESGQIWEKLFAYALDPTNGEALQTQLDGAYEEGWGNLGLPRYLPNEDERQHLMTWNGFTYDPAVYWKQIKVPALAIFGELDETIPVTRSLEILKSIGIPVSIYPKCGHGIKTVVDPEHFRWPVFGDGYLDDVLGLINR